MLADDPDTYAGPLAEMANDLLRQLAPPILHPLNPANELLHIERAFADGLAELEQAGYRTEGISTFTYFHRLAHLEKQATKAK